jgi:hypothetical protein
MRIGANTYERHDRRTIVGERRLWCDMSTANQDQPSELPSEGVPDPNYVSEIIAALQSLAPDGEYIPITRAKIIEVLEILIKTLRPLVLVEIDKLEDGSVLAIDHPAVVFLSDLADLFEDLDRGKSPDVFHAAANSTPGAYSLKDTRRVFALEELFRVTKQQHYIKSDAETGRVLAKKLKDVGYTLDGKEVTPDTLRRLRYRLPKRRPIDR